MKSGHASGHGHRTGGTPYASSSRPDDGNAFVPDTIGQLRPIDVPDAESAAEEFVASALMGESVGEDARDEIVDDEEGGPFIVLDDEGQLPPELEERSLERDGHDLVQREEGLRGARWAWRGG
jgi:hypothetical protein